VQQIFKTMLFFLYYAAIPNSCRTITRSGSSLHRPGLVRNFSGRIQSDRITNEPKDEATNHPQVKAKLEPGHQEKSNHITGKFLRRGGTQPEKQKEPDSQPAEAPLGTGAEQFLSQLSTL
jgi:hypothetical protein